MYNAEKYIDNCIKSVLNQTFDDFEIIIVNDGSTDNSLEICNKYKNNSKVQIVTQKNTGQQTARKNAYDLSSGAYCIFLDADDYWNCELLKTIYNYITKFNLDLIMFRYNKVSESGVLLTSSPSVFQDNRIFEEDEKEDLFKKFASSFDLNNLVCKAFKRNIFTFDMLEDNKFLSIRHGEDLLQSISLVYNAKKIGYIDVTLYNYRTNPTSVSNNFTMKILEDITLVRSILLRYMKLLNFDSLINREKLYNFYIKALLKNMYVISYDNEKSKDKKKFLRYLKRNELYILAMKNIKLDNFGFKQKIQIFLLKHNVTSLIIFEKIINLIRIKKISKFN